MARVSRAKLQAIERAFHQLIVRRLAEFPGVPTPILPKLQLPLPTARSPAWLPVPGMYGGFCYWLEGRDESATLISESWSRVVGGSAERHAITASGARLLEAGFDMPPGT